MTPAASTISQPVGRVGIHFLRLFIADSKQEDTKKQRDGTADDTEHLAFSGLLADIVICIDVDRVVVLIIDVFYCTFKVGIFDMPIA